MLFWLALAFLLVAIVGSIAFAVVRGLEAYRALKRVGREAGAALDRISVASGEIDLHLQAATASAEHLGESLARLARSRARLSVLTGAFADARSSLTGFYPRK